ncbi:MAG: hypothetical protein ACJ73S_15580 [Mycobacteriales bacterium]
MSGGGLEGDLVCSIVDWEMAPVAGTMTTGDREFDWLLRAVAARRA